MRAETLVIVNPVAGGGYAQRCSGAVARYFAEQGLRVAFAQSRSSDDLRRQAATAARDGVRDILALGGDGAVHYLVEALFGTDARAGILPAGNGNDIARSLGIPLDPLRAAEAFLRARPRSIDVVRATFRAGPPAHYVAGGGMGLDAEAAYRAGTTFKDWPGVTRYLAGALAAFNGAAFTLTAHIDGIRWSGRTLLAVGANAPYYGAGIRIAPNAEMDDGWLDVLVVRDAPWTRLIEAIPILLTSGDLRFEEVERFRCRRVRLEGDRPVKVHGDGELLGESPVELEIVPNAVDIMVPRAVQSV